MLIKLSEYDGLYRPGLKPRTSNALRYAADRGDIPGAFRHSSTGAWWVDTNLHDEIIRELALLLAAVLFGVLIWMDAG